MALGAGANVRAGELEAPCSIPYRGCDTADPFHFEAYIEGPPWGPRMSLIKTQTQPFWALVRLLSCFSMDLQYLSCARGGVGISIPSTLRFREGMEGLLTP